MSLGPWCQLGFWLLKATVCFVVVRAVALSVGEASGGLRTLLGPPLSPSHCSLQPPTPSFGHEIGLAFLGSSSSSLELLLLQRLRQRVWLPWVWGRLLGACCSEHDEGIVSF